MKSLNRTCHQFNGKCYCERKVLEKILKPYKNKDGYLQVTLNKNGKVKTFLVHRLVAQAFLSNEENKPEVNHKWGIKTDNRASELEWNTTKENCKHSWETGLKENTRKHCSELGKRQAKLNAKSVIQYDLQGNFIKEWGSVTGAGKKLKIDCSSISGCCKGKRKTAGRLYMEILTKLVFIREIYIWRLKR